MTIFTVTINKDMPNEEGFSVNLGEDCLEGKTDAELRAWAHQSKVIKIQGPLRKLKTAEEMEAHLRKTYKDAVVKEGIEKAESQDAVFKKIVREKFAGDKAAALEYLAKAAV
jgi:hypothetical protein